MLRFANLTVISARILLPLGFACDAAHRTGASVDTHRPALGSQGVGRMPTPRSLYHFDQGVVANPTRFPVCEPVPNALSLNLIVPVRFVPRGSETALLNLTDTVHEAPGARAVIEQVSAAELKK